MDGHRQPTLFCFLAPAAIIAVAVLGLAACGTTSPTKDKRAVHHPVDGWDAQNLPQEPASRYGNPSQYEVFGQTYQVRSTSEGYVERGLASWYGSKFHGRRTSSGEIYDMHQLTAAHKELPLPTFARVTHLENNRSVVVRINDRGPFVDDRIIDLSYAAAKAIGMAEEGVAPVEVEALTSPAAREPARHAATGEASELPDGGPFYLQVAAFRERQNAEQLMTRLRTRVPADVSIVRAEERPDNLYRIKLGPFSGNGLPEDVESILQSMDLRGFRFIVE